MTSQGKPDKSESQELRLRQVFPGELRTQLERHASWLVNGTPSGAMADLSSCDLSSVDLSQEDLRGAIFQGACLRRAKLRRVSAARFDEADLREADLEAADAEDTCFDGANLMHANLRRAKLRRTSFRKSRLLGANFRDADLREADLGDSIGLVAAQIGGSTVADAKLPRVIENFDGLKSVDEASAYGRTLFMSMLASSVYCWLTIATTTDADLLTNSASSPLPIIQTAIPIVGFYAAAPLLLMCLHLYFLLALQRLWEQLADLPAVFPDGRRLDQKAFPWLLNGIISAHVRGLREERPSLSRLQNGLGGLLAVWLVPITLLLFWARYLTRHEWGGTSLHIILLVGAVCVAYGSQRLARRTLRGEIRDRPLRSRLLRWAPRCGGFVVILLLCAVFYVFSVGAFVGVPEGDYRYYYQRREIRFQFRGVRYGNPVLVSAGSSRFVQWGPSLFMWVGYSPFANLAEAEVSRKPQSWTGREDQLPLAKGAYLRDADLRFASAERAFLVNADLRYANLSAADLREADLRAAKLDRTILVHTNLQGADLRSATGLTIGQLAMAWNWPLAKYSADVLKSLGFPADHNERINQRTLEGADFHERHLIAADLRNYNLRRANLQRADLRWARLECADLEAASLRGARLSGASLFGANLRRAVLTGADLTGVSLNVIGLESPFFGGGGGSAVADLRGADLREIRGVDAEELRRAWNWDLAFYSAELLNKLKLPPDHNDLTRQRLLREPQPEATHAPRAGCRPQPVN